MTAEYLPNGVTESFAYDGESRLTDQDVSLPQEESPLDRSYD